MDVNPYDIMSDVDKKALSLADMQLFALLILLIGSLIFIKSSSQNRELILRRYFHYDTPPPDPLATSLVGAKLNLSAVILIVYIALTRQNESDIAFSSGNLRDNFYFPASNLTKTSIIGLFLTIITLFSITKLINAQTNIEPVEEEEFIF